MYKVMVNGTLRDATPEEVLEIEKRNNTGIVELKLQKNIEINEARQMANSTSFLHKGKEISSDSLSRSDIDGIANYITLFGGFPETFPMFWKCTDNSYLSLESIDDFKDMYASMAATGTANFSKSEKMKIALAAAKTAAEIEIITWENFNE